MDRARTVSWIRRHRSPVTAAVVLVLGVGLIALDLDGGWGLHLLGRLDPWLGLLTLVPGCAVVAVKDRVPLPALVAGFVLFAIDFALLGSLAMLAVLHEVIYEATSSLSRSGRRRMLTALVVVGVGATVAVAIATRDVRAIALTLLLAFAIIGTPFWWATAVRSAQEVAELHAERVEDAARLADLQQRDAVRRERERMAGELHDAIAGHLSAVALRSEAALSHEPDERRDREALAVVREASLRSLDEMRSMILLLRSGEEPVAAADRLDRIEWMLDEARRSGLEVESAISAPRGLPTAVDQAAARILREALVNAAKHAAGGSVHVRVQHDGDALELEVRSRGGRMGEAGGAGVGLAMLVERAHAVGGSLDAGPDRGGWVVRARLPMQVRS